ncbi:hypothetical protein BDB01DRAFT_792895 [Pilobolus umbonatus]|nr:hypothetical protein BDB01DRAFT_792895 [Pilobolus umbonatus]
METTKELINPVSTTEVLVNISPQAVIERSTLARVLGFIPMMLFKTVGFATITIPLFFYRILTWSFTLHLNFSSVLIIIISIATVAYIIVRYRFLTKYSRLKTINNQKAAPSFDLHPDTTEDTEFMKPGYKNYPDEFLSAFLSSIKIFGYLEQPVFHELARHLQTKKLLAGDTLFRNPEQEKSFYIVLDGHVQMFVKPDNTDDDEEELSDEEYSTDEEWDDMDSTGTHKKDRFKNYTLINEVGAGSTLSSLFTILSIFRESFHRAEAKEKQRQKTMLSQASRLNPSMDGSSVDMNREGSQNDWRQLFSGLETAETTSSHLPESSTFRGRNKSSGLIPVQPSEVEDSFYPRVDVKENLDSLEMPIPVRNHSTPSTGYSVPHPRLTQELLNRVNSSRRGYRSVHPNIIACATVDTTLAVIPEEAFHKLTQKFPKAAAHIVQVIVTRFQRVTLMTSHRYLGLTKELLRLEKLVNESASLPELPPDFFEQGGMERLRRKFNDDDSSQSENGPYEINRSESSGIIKAIGIIDIPSTPSIHTALSPQGNNFLSNSPSTPGNSPHLIHQQRTGGEYSMEDDEHLRTSVMRCVANALGIKNNHPPEDSKSPFISPRVPRRFPFEEKLRAQHSDTYHHDTNKSHDQYSYGTDYDDDTDMHSTTSSIQSGNGSGSELFQKRKNNPIHVDDIQILYFQKDVVLVKEGAHHNGLYFVIDGLLECSMTPAEGEDVLGNPTLKQARNAKRQSQLDKRNKKSFRTPLSRSSSISEHEKPKEKTSSEDPGESSGSNKKKDKVVASEAPAGRSSEIDKENKKQEKTKNPSFLVKPGGLAGYLDSLSGFPSFVEIRAKTDTYVGYISRKNLDRITDRNPSVMLKLAKQLVGHVSPLILHIDLSLEWMQVSGGQIICKEGEPSDSIYMVLHGRLRTIHEKKEGELEILGEFGHGDSVGELEVLSGLPTSFTLHAIRDSELTRMPKTLFNALAIRHPEITLQISRIVAFRSLQMMQKNSRSELQTPRIFHLKATGDVSDAISSMTDGTPELYGRNNVNLKTIGILPVNSSVPVVQFAENLKAELIHSVGATCALLNSTTVTGIMGKYAFSRLGKLKMVSWLAEQEEKYRIVLYLADSGVTSQWTRTCIRQADCILLVGLGDGDPSVGEYERFLINMKTTARKELVLLHGERACQSGTTQNWLKNRLWIQSHHHIYMPMKQHPSLSAMEKFRPPWLAEQGRKMTAGSINMFAHVKDHIKEYYSAVPNFGLMLENKKKGSNTLNVMNSPIRNDFARLARRLCGKSVALVLGGGGARGIAHVGVIQAIEEAGIPIDIIGGTSIGSFVGGLYARNLDLVSVIARSKMFAGRVSSIWRQIMDLTYPVTAWFTGHEFNRAIWKCLGDSQIEDYWIPYYAVTTNITFSRMEVHTTGYAWRYIRASMSLSGYMPPICDNGNMLVDGGYMDNLPVSVAKNMGADIIIAVDVASEDDTSPVYYGDSVSGWWALIHGFNPFRTYTIPSIADIQSRLAYVSSVAKLEEAKITDGTLYLKLPVQQWGTLEFAKYNDIFQIGYEVGKDVVNKWRKAGYASGRIVDGDTDSALTGKEVKGKRARRYSI